MYNTIIHIRKRTKFVHILRDSVSVRRRDAKARRYREKRARYKPLR